jgi:hypothetical protein
MTIVALEPARLARVQAEPSLAFELVFPEDDDLEKTEDPSIDLDKTWHGIHYLLTGTTWEGEPPFSFLVAGGDDMRVHRPSEWCRPPTTGSPLRR